MDFSVERTLAAAPSVLPAFESATQDAGYAARGVDTSEMLFVYATVASGADDGLKPRQIIESGRALGQSTYILGRLYPRTPIVSIEYEADAPDAAKAVERLRPLGNVACLFGDARVLVPALTLPGDVVVIDGPKELRAMKLAMDVLRERRPALVFIHDCYKGSLIRCFLDRHVPHAFYSDDLRWVRAYSRLDTYIDAKLRAPWLDEQGPAPQRSYGGTFACIPFKEGFPRAMDDLKLTGARIADKLAGRRRREEARKFQPHLGAGS